MHNNQLFLLAYPLLLPKKMFLFRFWANSALQLRMEESAGTFAAYEVWYGEDMREGPT